MRAIAERAGVNHALVHRYFGTKDELIGSVIDREVARFKARMRKDFDLTMNNSQQLGLELSEWAAIGDWPLLADHRRKAGRARSGLCAADQ